MVPIMLLERFKYSNEEEFPPEMFWRNERLYKKMEWERLHPGRASRLWWQKEGFGGEASHPSRPPTLTYLRPKHLVSVHHLALSWSSWREMLSWSSVEFCKRRGTPPTLVHTASAQLDRPHLSFKRRWRMKSVSDLLQQRILLIVFLFLTAWVRGRMTCAFAGSGSHFLRKEAKQTQSFVPTQRDKIFLFF